MIAELASNPAESACETDVPCAHCALPVPRGLIESGASEQFCCAGCRAVYETIHSCGLDSYYRLRESADASFKPVALSADNFASFDTSAFGDLYITTNHDGTRSVDFVLEGVSCAACVWLIERLPRVLEGVIEARLSLRQATVRITWDPSRVAASRIARTLDRFGYTPHPAKGQARKDVFKREERKRLVQLGVAGAIMGNTMLLGFALYAGLAGGMESQFRLFFRWISGVLGMMALVWPGAIFFKSAYAALRTRTLNLDVPIAMALLVGGVAGTINIIFNRGEIYFDSLTVLVFLLLVGRWMQYKQQRRADAAVELLFSLTPSTCHVVTGDLVTDAPVEAIKPSDVVEVRSGELIPADGAVIAGRSAVNQALLTGESMLTEVEPGHAVHAGAQNVGSILRLRVEKTGESTRVGQLMRLVERGVREKPAIVQFADRVGAWFVLAVSIAAAATFAFWCRVGVAQAIDHTVALLIVTCPCVLGLATPLTLAMAIGRLARADILVKSGAALERLARGGKLLLDKTGTLTEGRLRLIEWVGDSSVRDAVVAVETYSNHPIAKALVAELGGIGTSIRPTEVVERNDGGILATLGGKPISIGSPRFMARDVKMPFHLDQLRQMHEASGATVVCVAIDGQGVAIAALGDRLRTDSRSAVETIVGLGWVPSILSGDGCQIVRSVAEQVGISKDCARGNVSPEEKLLAVRQSEVAGAKVTVMVGDGVNDAAALAAADVGIAVHGGAEASLAAADVYVARPGLMPLAQLFATSQHAMRVIRRNLLVSLGYNVLAGSLAATGFMTPLLAAIIMPVSSATVLGLAVVSITTQKNHGGRSWK